MMIEKSGSIRLKDIPIPSGATPEQRELAQGMVRVNHLYRSALKVAVTQMEILDEEFCSLNDHSPIHHIEYRIKSLDSIVDKLKRRGYEVYIGKNAAKEIDFIGIRRDERIYVQVCVQLPENSDREIGNLMEIQDHYPKYVVTTNSLDVGNENGIRIVHLADFLLDEQW